MSNISFVPFLEIIVINKSLLPSGSSRIVLKSRGKDAMKEVKLKHSRSDSIWWGKAKVIINCCFIYAASATTYEYKQIRMLFMLEGLLALARCPVPEKWLKFFLVSDSALPSPLKYEYDLVRHLVP